MKIELGGSSMMLFIIFLILKLEHIINWSWWLVTIPLWLPLCIVIPIFLIAFYLFFYGRD
jgi:hypothetical protein